MTITTYDPDSSMREARALYFAVNGFGEDGGYGDAWVDFRVGPLPAPFPNTKARIEAVRFHDLHHILTGYDTDFSGELEISAWELGAGCKGMGAAWVLNLGGLGAGLFVSPRRVFRAFARGLGSQSFYGRDLEELLHLTVAEARAQMGVDEKHRAGLAGWFWFLVAALAGLVVGAALLCLALVLVPVGLALGVARKHAPKKAAPLGA